jgi:predicted O-linked N-acetylglucosamine transferase (SPINDLY family)
LCRSILQVDARHFEALSLLGSITAQTGRPADAAELLRRALAVRPDAVLHNDYGNVQRALQRFDEALWNYDRALQLRPDYFVAHFNRGNVLLDLARFEEALRSYDRALELKADFVEVYINRAIALRKLGRQDDAVESCRRATELRPDFPEAHNNRGISLQELGRAAEALESFDRALAHRANYAEAHNNRAAVLRELRRFDEALESCARALAASPQFAAAYNSRGLALFGLRRFEEALDSYERALRLEPQLPEAHNNRGLALQALWRFEAAVESYRCALALKPDFAEAYYNEGNALDNLRRPDEARDSYYRALRLKPDQRWLYGFWMHANMRVCEWRDFDARLAPLLLDITQLKKATEPFPLLALTDSPAAQRQAAEIWVSECCPARDELPPLKQRPRSEKIRIGYFSADFHGHATSYLAARLFEAHDRTKFRVVAISFGREADDDMRARLVRAFDQFVDVRTRSDQQVAELSRSLGIDIAVDLKGFTQDQRMGIFSYRAAPIQVSYLGYPGTSGAPYVDYLIADRTLVPAEQRAHYSEKLVYLPHSYQVNDDRLRSIAHYGGDRTQLGLPATGFVFCCFNNCFKITPEIFDSWMRILQQVPASVLWLFQDTETAANNLREQAEARGVSASRLVFASYAPPAEHLARHRAADLFLDTLPCNAHTTASDALWAGLPVLTRSGQSFAGRVAASLLNAVDLPELITRSAAQYEGLAVELATHPERLAGIRDKLQRNRLTTPLFDTELYTRHLEDAYAQMYARYQAGDGPADIEVAARLSHAQGRL